MKLKNFPPNTGVQDELELPSTDIMQIILEFFPFHMNQVCISFNKFITDVGISETKASWIIYEIANDLKMTILPYIFFLSFHNFMF